MKLTLDSGYQFSHKSLPTVQVKKIIQAFVLRKDSSIRHKYCKNLSKATKKSGKIQNVFL